MDCYEVIKGVVEVFQICESANVEGYTIHGTAAAVVHFMLGGLRSLSAGDIDVFVYKHRDLKCIEKIIKPNYRQIFEKKVKPGRNPIQYGLDIPIDCGKIEMRMPKYFPRKRKSSYLGVVEPEVSQKVILPKQITKLDEDIAVNLRPLDRVLEDITRLGKYYSAKYQHYLDLLKRAEFINR